MGKAFKGVFKETLLEPLKEPLKDPKPFKVSCNFESDWCKWSNVGAVDWRRHKGRTSGSEQTRGFREFRKGPLRVSVKGFFKPTLGSIRVL